MRRRRASNLHNNVKPLKVVVLGKDGVGKSALTVRFLTRRFIGEYDQTLESTYRHIIQVDNEDVSLDISDTAGECSGDKLRRWTRRGDLYLVLYSIVDRSSFDEARWIARYVKDHRNTDSMSMVIVATKKDLDHLRRVDIEEGIGFSNEIDCTFYEVSISEGYSEVQELLQELLKRLMRQRNEKKDSLRVPSLSGLKRSPSFEKRKRPSSLEKIMERTPQMQRKDLSATIDQKGTNGNHGNHDKNNQDRINNNLSPTKSCKGMMSRDEDNDLANKRKNRDLNRNSSPISQRKKRPFVMEKVKGPSSINELQVPQIISQDCIETAEKPKSPFGLQKAKTRDSFKSSTRQKKDSSSSVSEEDKLSPLPQEKGKGPFLLDRLKSSSTDKLTKAVPSNERLTATSSFGRFREGFGKTFGRKKAIYL